MYIPIRERIKEQHLAGRAINPECHLCLDHVHPVEDGHAVIAREYLSVMGETEGVANRNQYLSAAYAARYIYSPTERVVTMNVTKENFTGCPYLAIWLNGVKVHFGQETSKSVTLKKGDNILFLRSSQPEWAWQQSVTFAASDTCPDVSDLEYGVAPSGNIDIGDATEFDEGRVKVSGASKIVCLSETDNEYVFTYRGSGAIEFSEAAKVDLLVVGGGGGGTITTRDGVNGGSGGGACGLFGFWSGQQVGVPGQGSDGQGNAGGAVCVSGVDDWWHNSGGRRRDGRLLPHRRRVACRENAI